MYSNTHSSTDVTIQLMPSSETPTGQSRQAYQLAGVFTIVGGILTILSGPGTMIVGAVIDLILGVGLIQLRRGARQWMVIRAIGAAIMVPMLSGIQDNIATGVVVTCFGWMYVAALLLLLTGRSATWRIVTSAVLFSIYALASLLGLLILLLQ